ncbi:uncharacterized protein [Euphorbia lathyris]|uniref:uncharacterized protein n=1 Tax=Euphorbia lathyris TaxID=212925 RepID=UPI0033135F8D
MASAPIIACIAALLLLQPMIATSDLLSPIFSPIIDDLCKKVECGKGSCKKSNSSFSYECECDPGWKQTRSDDDDDLKFLPCIIPNCSMDLSCGAAPSPVQDKIGKANASSIFDPCFWTSCGGGSCNKTSPFTYSCECTQGYYNLLNVSAFPCFKECAIGMDCANLGISLSNKTFTPAQPVLNDNSSSNMLGSIHWLIVLIIYVCMVQCK